MIVITKSKFGLLVTCAVRYALGRMTYMPSSVAGIVTDALPMLDDRTLFVLEKDLEEHVGVHVYEPGFKDIETTWRHLLNATKHERCKRNERK